MVDVARDHNINIFVIEQLTIAFCHGNPVKINLPSNRRSHLPPTSWQYLGKLWLVLTLILRNKYACAYPWTYNSDRNSFLLHSFLLRIPKVIAAKSSHHILASLIPINISNILESFSNTYATHLAHLEFSSSYNFQGYTTAILASASSVLLCCYWRWWCKASYQWLEWEMIS